MSSSALPPEPISTEGLTYGGQTVIFVMIIQSGLPRAGLNPRYSQFESEIQAIKSQASSG